MRRHGPAAAWRDTGSRSETLTVLAVRLIAAIVLVVGIALAGAAIETRNLRLRERISLDYYRLQVLEERYNRQRARYEQLGAPARLFDMLETSGW